MIESHTHAEEFHGADGLGDAGLSKTDRQPEREHAALAIVRLARAHEGDLGLIALGPLTNIALACNLDPDLPRRVARLVVMGGAWQARGNQTPAAEFNIAVDPESACAVFDRFPNVVVLPWEVSLDQMMPFEVFERIRGGSSSRARFFAAMCRVVYDWRDRFGFAGVPLPDPLAMAVALDERTIARELRARVRVDIGNSVGRALSSLDYRHPQPNARVVIAVHGDVAWPMIERAWML
jgi:purine nucleosidase